MSSPNAPGNDADLEAFLTRKSPLGDAYDAIEPLQPPEVLDSKILAIAHGALKPAGPVAQSPKPNPTAVAAASAPVAVAATPGARAAPPPRAVDADDDDDDDRPALRRRRWLVPAALAASVLAAVGIGVSLLGRSGPALYVDKDSYSDSTFARRARERNEADKAAAEVAAATATASQEAEANIPPPLPPPVFEPEGPQVEDLDTAIALVRRELVMANQLASAADAPAAAKPEVSVNSLRAAAPAGGAEGKLADAAPPAPAAAAAESDNVIQSRDRRLAKILELYDAGKPDLAAASLEIFLRDFADYPISQRILEAQPKATDAAVE
ncbi:MAG: hypothetical protein ABI661_02405 [Gammaproteobacteria bacterium]